MPDGLPGLYIVGVCGLITSNGQLWTTTNQICILYHLEIFFLITSDGNLHYIILVCTWNVVMDSVFLLKLSLLGIIWANHVNGLQVLQVTIHIPIVGLMRLEPNQCQQAHPPQLFVTYKEFLKGSLSGDSRLFDHFFLVFELGGWMTNKQFWRTPYGINTGYNKIF